MKAAIIQENDEIAIQLFGLMKKHKTNLAKLSAKYDLNYQQYYRALHHPVMSCDFINAFCKLINPKIKVEYTVKSVSFNMDINYID